MEKILLGLLLLNLAIAIDSNLKVRRVMNLQERFNKQMEDLNAATNGVAANLQRLKDQIAAGSITTESLDQLDKDIVALNAMGTQADATGNAEITL